jgi:hypothetical protein
MFAGMAPETSSPSPLPSSPRADARVARSAAWRIVALVAVALILSGFAWWTAWATYPHTQGIDGPHYFKTLEAGKWSVLRDHEFPGWNPYECGGLPLWDNPESIVGAPLLWLTFVMGTTYTMLVWYTLHSALGFLSMWALLRLDLRLSRAACFIGSAMWAFNGAHFQHYGVGHTTFVAFELFPLALFWWRRAETDLRCAVYLGALVAWSFYEGGVYPLPQLIVVLALESPFRVWPGRRALAMAKAGGVVIAVGFALGASRMIPVLHQLHLHDRYLNVEDDHLRWNTLRHMFLARDFPMRVPGQEYKWHEYSAYVGPFLFVLSLVGILVAGVEHVWLVVFLVASFVLMLGHFAPWAPWTFLHAHLFPFKQLRVPARFNFSVVLALSAFAAIAVDRVSTRLHALRPLGARLGTLRSVIVLFAVLGVGDMMSVGLTTFPARFNEPPSQQPIASSRHFFLQGPKLASRIDQPAQNRGRIKCWEQWGFEQGATFWEGDVPQARLTNPSVASFRGPINRTQNSFRFTVNATEPTRVLMNGSYDDGWHASTGTVVEADKLLAVDVPAGLSRVRLHYWPYGLTFGLWLTGIALVAFITFLVWDHRTRTTPPPPLSVLYITDDSRRDQAAARSG